MAWKSFSTSLIAIIFIFGFISVRRTVHRNRMPYMVEDVVASLKPRAMSAYFRTTGITDGGIQQRMEIRALQSQNPDLFNLYLLGLARFKAMPQTDSLSYYQIAGIHGAPWISWDGQPTVDESYHGYCPHFSNIFPTWHRPYLALFEQLVYANILDAIDEFPPGPDRDKYAALAPTFRLPYWDWAKAPPEGENLVPEIVTLEQVQVTGGNGTYMIDNPLYDHKFEPLIPSDMLSIAPWSVWNKTVRWPTSSDATGESQPASMVSAFQTPMWLETCEQTVYNLFAFQTTFETFSNNAWKTDVMDGVWDNIESIHDNVHGQVGGNIGHMSVFDFSAFDPMFWLHHVNLDRIITMWQIYHPDSYVDLMPSLLPLWWAAPGTMIDENTGLQPFRSDDYGNFWTSASARYPETFGYTYPETANQTQNGIAATINQLYMPKIFQTALTQPSLRKARRSSAPLNGSTVWQYSANIRVKRFATNGSFTIYVFLGDTVHDSSSWSTDPSLAGYQKMFSGAPVKGQAPHAHAVASVPLTSQLSKNLGTDQLQHMNQTAVVDYLQKNLHWKVLRMNGKEVPSDQLPSLKIALISSEIQLPQTVYEFPRKVSESRVHLRVTEGKPGGYAGDHGEVE